MGIFQNNLMGAAAAAASAGGDNFYSHQIANSVRFIRDDASKLSRALGTATANTKWTFSTWVKFSSFPTGTTDDRCLLGATGSTYSLGLGLTSSTSNEPQLLFIDYPSSASGPNAGGVQTLIYLKRIFRDPNAWYHIVVNQDTTQGTASDRIKFYINGELQTDFDDHSSGGSATPFYPSQNSATINDSIHTLLVGVDNADNAANTLDGYMAETYFIDGTAYAGSDFGETKNGVWIPKDASGLTFGNNGFYLKYESSGDLGNDSSGNNNDYTVSNISAHDQMLDSPTFNSDSNGGNFCTANSVYRGESTTASQYGILSEGNLTHSYSGSSDGAIPCTHKVPAAGKWYFEYRIDAGGGTVNYSPAMGIMDPNEFTFTSSTIGQNGLISYDNAQNRVEKNDVIVGTYGGSRGSNGDVMGIAVDMDNGAFYVSKNGTFQTISGGSQGDPTSGASRTGAGATWTPASEYTSGMVPMSQPTGGNVPIITMNFGQNGTFNGNETAGGNSDTNGYGNFFSAVPSGYSAICSGALTVAAEVDPAQTDENYPQKLFGAKLYTGNGGTNAITGLGFKPDVVWGKSRSNTQDHFLADSTNGTGKDLIPNSNVAQQTENGVTSFDTDGWTMGSIYNANAYTYVAWNWRANGGTTSTNTQGDITSTVQVDPSGCFSIVTYTGESATRTIGHGLSATPTTIWVKSIASSYGWANYFKDNGLNKIAFNSLGNDTGASTLWGNTHPTSSVFSVGDGSETGKSTTYVAYCFAPCEGYISIGSYLANGSSTDNTFVYTGFRPAFLLVKGLVTGAAWTLIDNKRDGYNPTPESLEPNSAGASYTSAAPFADLLSNGFKVRTNNAVMGSTSYDPYVYVAMAENPFKYATAR